jgi:hypothetical protein
VSYEEPEGKTRQDKDLKDISNSRIGQELSTMGRKYGPIQKEQAYLWVMRQWQFSRVGSRIERKLDQRLTSLERSGSVHEHKEFIWPSEDNYSLKVRLNSDEERDIDEIAIEELAKACAIILENGFSIEKDDLVLETARFYGFGRRGQKIRNRIREAIDLMEDLGLAEEKNGRLERTDKDIDESLKSFIY